MDPSLRAGLIDCAGPGGWIDGASPEAAPFLNEWRDRWHGSSPLILRPARRDQVAAILTLADETNTAVVAQGGNTGLVGGQIPFGPEVVLSLNRMRAIRQVDPVGDSLVAEAGVPLAEVQQAADRMDRFFPLSLASEGTATIGGLISTNAGGTGVLRYGTMRDLVLGLEVVLADGRVLHRLEALRKDNTGLDLKHLFIGTEGTHGIITAATLKLHPKPRDRQTAFVALDHVEAALELLNRARALSGDRVSGFELMPHIGFEFLRRHKPDLRQPFQALDHPWYALIEMTSGDAPGPLAETMDQLLEGALDLGLIRDGVVASSLSQGQAFWALRENLSEVQKYEGGSIKHDVSVPLDRLAGFIERASHLVETLVPGCRPVPFGHVGDGNVHFNVSQPVGADTKTYLDQWPVMTAQVHDLVHQLGGSISAEHGIGQAKIDDLYRLRDPVSLDVMSRIKSALDPKGLLNPGKVLRRL